MNYSTRIKRAKGKVQVRITIDLTEEELSGVERISDDKYCTVDTVKSYDPELSLAYARTLCFWVSLWNSSNKERLVKLAIERRQSEKLWAKRKEKKRATRSRKK